GA
ncbi:thiazole biosynthesis ThiG family protein, partial [Vibrio parahaemolyticus V-223/04]